MILYSAPVFGFAGDRSVGGAGPLAHGESGAPVARPADCGLAAQELLTVRPDGSVRRDIGSGFSGLFSPRGARLAVDDPDPCDLAANLEVARADGSHRRHIVGDDLERWLPDGRLVVSQSVGSTMHILDASTGRVLLIVPHAAALQTFDVSCAGRVAAVYHTRNQSTLAVYTPDQRQNSAPGNRGGAGPVLVTREGLDRPVWSPDGRTLMFERAARLRKKTTVALWEMRTGDWGAHRFSRPGSLRDQVVGWSPDGRRILFLREANGTGRAIVANADGSRLHVVYRGAFDSALWSPDSQSIAFGAGSIVNATTGAVKRRLDFGLGLDDWQALPGGPPPLPCADRVEQTP